MKFDRTKHKLIAVDADGNHLHVTAEDVVEAAAEARDPREVARERLRAGAAAARAAFATPGKELVYLQQEAEARACFDDGDPAATYQHPTTGVAVAKYPHLVAMRGIHVPETDDVAADLRSAAVLVLGKAADFRQRSADIERVLALALASVAAATTAEECAAVLDAVRWP